ncbi:MAG: hypothetical protein GOU97_00720 [Nanoarchaeota archaeon]|nr:hypothetical protein [Nanoarchaeota archaeon]
MLKKTFIILTTLLLLSPVQAELIGKATTQLPGVRATDTGYKGILATVEVEVHNGSGRVFVDTMPLTEVDTQASARLAKEVSCNTLNLNCNEYDFFYIIRSHAPIVGGPSAGASLAGATLAAFTNKTVNESVMLTGTINPDGSVGRVGSILTKTEAAYEGGATKFLIPKGQSIIYLEEGATTQTLDLTDYAKKNWRVSIIEVKNVKEVYKHLTGYEIIQEKIPETKSSQVYERLMKNMSQKLLSISLQELQIVEDKKENVALTYAQSQELNTAVSEQKSLLLLAQSLYNLGEYYSAASYAVRASITLKFHNNYVDYLGTDSQKIFVKSIIDKVNDEIKITEKKVEGNITLTSLYDIELLTVSTDRIREAEQTMEEAYKYYYNDGYVDALYETSFAEVRKVTAETWYEMIGSEPGNLSVTFDTRKLEAFAYERLRQARDSMTYANTIYGPTPGVAEHLQKSEDAIKTGKHVFSIFESTQAIALSNLILDTSTMDAAQMSQVLEDKKQDATQSINSARQKGLLPILAMSYKEYSKQFEAEQPETALIYLSFSKHFADISEDLLNAAQTGEIIKRQEIKIVKSSDDALSQQILSSSALILIGFMLGMIFSIRLYKRK